MKKNIFYILLSLIILFLLFKNNQDISINILSISYLFLSKVLVFLFPIFIISKILINYNFPYYISKLFNNNIFFYIFFMSFISGSPNNAYLIKDLLNKNIINIKEANKYIKCSFFNNPLFLYSMLSKIFNKKIAIYIIVIQILSNLIIYFIKPIKNNNIYKIKPINFSTLIINSIKEGIDVFASVYLTIILFNILISILPYYFNSIIGIIELTQGLDYLRYLNINLLIKMILANIFISFGGLSIHLQVKSALQDTLINYNNFLYFRIIQIILSLFILITTFRIIIYS